MVDNSSVPALRVDPEFRDLIPPLTLEERAGLERSILAEGVRDPIIVWDGVIVDGHNRHEIASGQNADGVILPFRVAEREFEDRRAAEKWILENQLSRRNLSDVARYRIGEKLRERYAAEAKERQREHGGTAPGKPKNTLPDSSKSVGPSHTDKRIAKDANLSRDKVQKLRKIEQAEPALLDAIDEGRESVNSAYKRVRKQEKSRERAEERAKAAEEMAGVVLDERVQVVRADFRDAFGDVPDGSVDLILTDPPYPAEYLPLYSDLAYLASTCLKPGGVLAAMIGQSYLPEIVERLSEHLQYHWTLAYVTPGGQAVQLWQRKVNTFWKPVLVFANGEYGGEWFGDVAKSDVNDNDKRFHHWGQSESGTSDLMERLSKPGDMVIDPFVGGGTTAIVAAMTGRRFLGCDLDAKAIETTTYRLKELAANETRAS